MEGNPNLKLEVVAQSLKGNLAALRALLDNPETAKLLDPLYLNAYITYVENFTASLGRSYDEAASHAEAFRDVLGLMTEDLKGNI